MAALSAMKERNPSIISASPVSEWRYFKIETFAVKTPTAYILPTFRFQT